eukprot:228796-Rhodomonas_salina.2
MRGTDSASQAPLHLSHFCAHAIGQAEVVGGSRCQRVGHLQDGCRSPAPHLMLCLHPESCPATSHTERWPASTRVGFVGAGVRAGPPAPPAPPSPGRAAPTAATSRRRCGGGVRGQGVARERERAKAEGGRGEGDGRRREA